MKILIIHNRYLFAGGEDRVIESEIDLLKAGGHEVIPYFRSNEEVNLLSWQKKLKFVFEGVTRSKKTYRDLSDLIKKHHPDAAHFHNPFFMMTPSAYDACYDANVPIVQSLHNYRFLCMNGVLFHNGELCEECLSQGAFRGVVKRCMQNSLLKSFFAGLVLKAYRGNHVLDRKVQAFIAPSEFCKKMYCQHAGIDKKKIYMKPHFVEDPGISQEKGEYVLYIGALREYKGLHVLLKAWEDIKGVPLKTIGKIFSDDQCLQQDGVEFLGEKNMDETIEAIKKAICIVVPSVCYETFARVIIEAYACGKPVIASDIGAIRERVIAGETGILVKPGDEKNLAMKVRRFIEDPQLVGRMGKRARQVYENFYRPDENYEQLIDIYQKVLK